MDRSDLYRAAGLVIAYLQARDRQSDASPAALARGARLYAEAMEAEHSRIRQRARENRLSVLNGKGLAYRPFGHCETCGTASQDVGERCSHDGGWIVPGYDWGQNDPYQQ